MPRLTITGAGTFEIPEGTRLVKAIESCGIDIGHRCGGKARCTTCRVRFVSGEPDAMTEAEYDKLKERELLSEVRLSCQILTAGDVEVEPMMRVADMGWADPGPEPTDAIEPEPVWRSRPE